MVFVFSTTLTIVHTHAIRLRVSAKFDKKSSILRFHLLAAHDCDNKFEANLADKIVQAQSDDRA